MSKLALVLLLLVSWLGGLTQIARSNTLKLQAQAAYNQKQYSLAAAAWAELLQTQSTPNPAVRLNLAHALRLQGQKLKAAREYQQVVRTGSADLKSVAHLQLGNMLAQAQDYEQALTAYKAALKADAANYHARYNYELLKKYLEQQQPEEQDQETAEEEEAKQKNQQQPRQSQAQQGGGGGNQPQPRQTEDGNNQTPLHQGTQSGSQLGQNATGTDTTETPPPNLPRQTGQEGQMPGEETSVRRLEQIRMTEERARALLDAMRRAELQYLQQVPRRQQSRPDPNKPEW